MIRASYLVRYAALAQDVGSDINTQSSIFGFRVVTGSSGSSLSWDEVMLASDVPKSEVDRYIDAGFFARIYQDASGQVVVAFRASISRNSDPNSKRWQDDWAKTNYPEIAGQTTEQYLAAKKLAEVVRDFLKPPQLVLTGFSKGGGQASYAGSYADRVITFDGARNADSAAGKNNSQINVIVRGDPVGDPNASLPAGVGVLPGLYLSTPSVTGGTHSIDGILGGLTNLASPQGN